MTTTILNIENIKSTELSMEANVITLDSIPTIDDQSELFTNDSIILEF